ncbi:hypothetical protein JQX13_30575 [Archangium violaceum]|uniref:hypothetical protein n=1 Tax=Archangium violaceum TaxID=83451 RepID=UPI00193B41F0|nr:hypothetical protein [Archangium violaceum]QRK04584.1 hypothetical protein JQX13_30575 [Archangium violaceum]
MSTSNNKLTVPAEMPPAAPADLVAKRDQIVAELEKAAKEASGTLQQVLRKMITLLASTKPGAPYDPQSLQDVKDAFVRYSQDPEALAKPRPAILMESVEWMQAYLASRGFPVQGAGAAPAAAPASKPAAAAGTASKDSFESGSAQHARSLGGDVPVPPGQSKEQEQLESMKSWMLNPSLGKVKG